MSRAVHIRAVGVVSPVGHNMDLIWRCLLDRQPNFSAIDAFDTDQCGTNIAGNCRNLPFEILPERKLVKMMNRRDLIGLMAAIQAWRAAGRMLPEPEAARWGAYVGSNNTRMGDLIPYFKPVRECVDVALLKFNSCEFGARMQSMINPLIAIHALQNNGLAQISQTLGLQGANCCYYDHEVSGLRAIVEATKRLRAGDIEGAVCGASHAPIDPFQFAQALVDRQQMCRRMEEGESAITPWMHKSKGTILSEAACYMILARRSSELGPAIHGIGAAAGTDGVESLTRAIRNALADAGAVVGDLAGIIGQGAGCTREDTLELRALANLGNSRPMPVMSPKSVLGETREANGVLALAIARQALQAKILPPTVNFSSSSKVVPKNIKIVDQVQELENGLLLTYAFNKHGLANAVVIGE